MSYSNEDRKNIGDLYMEMYSRKGNKPINEAEHFFDVEDEADRLDGDLDYDGADVDGDNLPDALEEKVYTEMNSVFGDSFRRDCDDIKEKFNLTCDEFCMYFKGWFDKNHVDSHLEGDI